MLSKYIWEYKENMAKNLKLNDWYWIEYMLVMKDPNHVSCACKKKKMFNILNFLKPKNLFNKR